MSELKRQTVHGIKWVVGVGFLQRFISLATTAVLARLLTPSIFGLFALAFLAIDALGLFKSMGFDSALIQRKKYNERDNNTAFFIILALGVIVYTTLSLAAPLIAKFLNNNELVVILRVLGFVFIINCLNRVPITILQKRMQFAKVSIAEFVNAITFSMVAIILAFQGLGVWSLIWGFIARMIMQMILIWSFAKWRPRFEFDKKIASELFSFGKFIFLVSLVSYLRFNLANLLIGKLLGVTALGLYAIAFNVAHFAAKYLGGRIHQVIYPAYSTLQSNLYDLRSASLKVTKHVSLIAIPLGVGIFLMGPEFLRLVFGEKWIGASRVLIILAWAGVFNTLNSSLDPIFLALGRSKISFWIAALQVSIFLVFIIPAAELFGINGVGAVVSISTFITFMLTLFWVKKLLSISTRQIYLSLKPALLSTLIMSLAILFVKHLFFNGRINILLHYNLILIFFFAIAIYIFSLFKIERVLFKEFKEIIF